MNVKRFLFYSFLFSLLCISCKKEDDDKRKVVYEKFSGYEPISGRSGQVICVRNLDGSNNENTITEFYENYHNEVFMPNGKTLLFVYSFQSGGGKLGFIDLDGTNLRFLELSSDNFLYSGPSCPQISNNKQTIYFMNPTTSSAYGIFSCNINGEDIQELTEVESLNQIKLSPDGSSLAFSFQNSNYKTELGILDLSTNDTIHLSEIIQDPNNEIVYNFSSDGKKIVYHASVPSKRDAIFTYITEVETGNRLLIFADTMNQLIQLPVFNKSGNKLAFINNAPRDEHWNALGSYWIGIMNVDGTEIDYIYKEDFDKGRLFFDPRDENILFFTGDIPLDRTGKNLHSIDITGYNFTSHCYVQSHYQLQP